MGENIQKRQLGKCEPIPKFADEKHQCGILPRPNPILEAHVNENRTPFEPAARTYTFLLLALLLLSACHGPKAVVQRPLPEKQAQHDTLPKPPLAKLEKPAAPPSAPVQGGQELLLAVSTSPIFGQGFTGFLLYDPSTHQTLCDFNSDKHFTPASTTKILTLYTALSVLGDSMPAIKYIEKGNSIYFKGTGDPSFLHPYIETPNALSGFLEKNRSKNWLYHPYDFKDARYGSGWAWDDYPYYFQPEKSGFPIHSNVVAFEHSRNGQWNVFPNLFKNMLRPSPEKEANLLRRKEQENIFYYNKNDIKNTYLERKLPAILTDALFLSVLKEVTGVSASLAPDAPWERQLEKTVYSMPVDSVYRQLMLPSDNFVAEQLMLVCSEQLFGEQSVERAINWSKENLLAACPTPIKWVDGSGLSRYNLLTPRALVFALEGILQKTSFERVRNLFPIGGQSGTIADWYGNSPPFVFAKSGTLSGVHCLSGYLITKSGKILIFSFMHNNYLGPSKQYKQEMDKILRMARSRY